MKKNKLLLILSVASLLLISPVYSESKNTEKNDKLNFAGWDKNTNKNIDETYGKIRIKVKAKNGAFNLSMVNKSGKSIPVLSTSNEFITSSFYLLCGKKIIKLNEDSIVKTAARKTTDGVQIAYGIDKFALVIVDFNFFSVQNDQNIDTVKISASVKNLSSKKENFELKLLLDTVLGETDRHHFYLSSKTPVKNETTVHNFTNDSWFVSKNVQGNMQFLFHGAEATSPSYVTMANYSTLNDAKWEPDFSTYRSFDTLLSYNNSAVEIFWPSHKVSANSKYTEVFYISFALGVDELHAQEYIKNDNEYTAPAVVENERKFSNEYIDKLLQYVESLDSSGENIERDEIIRLNAELDTILEIIRK